MDFDMDLDARRCACKRAKRFVCEPAHGLLAVVSPAIIN